MALYYNATLTIRQYEIHKTYDELDRLRLRGENLDIDEHHKPDRPLWKEFDQRVEWLRDTKTTVIHDRLIPLVAAFLVERDYERIDIPSEEVAFYIRSYQMQFSYFDTLNGNPTDVVFTSFDGDLEVTLTLYLG